MCVLYSVKSCKKYIYKLLRLFTTGSLRWAFLLMSCATVAISNFTDKKAYDNKSIRIFLLYA